MSLVQVIWFQSLHALHYTKLIEEGVFRHGGWGKMEGWRDGKKETLHTLRTCR